MQASTIPTPINELNTKAWSLRYANLEEAMRMALAAKQTAEEQHDFLNLAYAKLTIAQLGFWKTSEGDQLKEATEALAAFIEKNELLGISRAHCVCAGMYDQYGQYEKAMHHAQHAVQVAKQINDSDNTADCYTVLGLVYSRTFDYTQAIKKLKQGLEIRKQVNDTKAIASSLNLIGRNLVLSKNFTEAERYYNESLALREKTGDTAGIPWTYLGLASLFHEKGEAKTAIHYYNKAELTQTKTEKRFELLCLIGRSKIYLLQEAIDTAIAHLNKALAIAEQLKIISLRSEIHQLLSATYEKNEEFSKALYHHKLFNNLQQEILSNEKVNQLKHQQIAFSIETAEKEAEIHMLKHIELKNAFDKIAIQHHELEIKNKEITDSLDYAKYIQDAYFPSTELFSKLLPDAFLLYKPKDIVSGDFYWFHQLPPVYKAERANNTQTLDRTNENFDSSNNLIQSEGTLLIAAADATGHGVPGAIMSVISCNALNEVVKKGAVYQPDLILNQVRDSIIGAFEQHGNYSARKDGMDIALVSLSPFPLVGNSSRLQFAGAYNPLWIIKKGKPTAESVVTFKTESHYLIEVRADRQPIGMYERMEPFTLHETIVNKGDTIYMFSDGYADQFGGREGEKFKTKALKELLLHIQGNTMREQQAILLNVFNDWKNGIEQVDDVCVIGIRI